MDIRVNVASIRPPDSLSSPRKEPSNSGLGIEQKNWQSSNESRGRWKAAEALALKTSPT